MAQSSIQRQSKQLRQRSGILCFVAALLLSGTLYAAPVMDREQAAQHIKRNYGGKILDLRPVKSGKGRAYRVKLLQPSGRVKLMLIDAKDGKQRPFDKSAPKE